VDKHNFMTERVDVSLPEIRLWIFNNPIRGITEQLEYLSLSLRQAGYCVSISNQPSEAALNVLIENLNEKTYPEVERFCIKTGKKIAIVMTEHIDFVDRRIYFHGLPFSIPSEYMHALTRRVRLLHLLIAKSYIKCFIRLGDLPALTGIEHMFNGLPVVTLPYPNLSQQDRAIDRGARGSYDLVFTGAITSYRRKVLENLEEHFQILTLQKQVSRRRRDAANTMAKAVLNIPQDADWKWISSMRIMAAWRCGVPVINVGLGLIGEIGEFCVNVPADRTAISRISSVTKQSGATHKKQLAAYERFVLSQESGVFPSGLFKVWTITELTR
jgi:hypothetical protein